MHVIMISPGFPSDMPLFTRGLAQVGAKVYGVGDGGLSPEVRDCLADYLQVRNLWDEEAVVEQVLEWLRGKEVDRVECLWEPGMVLAARLRERIGVPGMTVEQTLPVRDKESMKQALDRAGLRTPRHTRASTSAQCREAAEAIGYPLIIKPIDGAGSADTHKLENGEDLERALNQLQHVPEVSVEEYIEGEEFTYDTVCGGGTPLFENVAWYRPKPLLMRQYAWLSPQSICVRDLNVAEIQKGVDLGRKVIQALGFQAGFTHMEWFLTPEGEAVFGEIGARAPGGRLVHTMNYCCDTDLFSGWAEAVCYGSFSQPSERRYNAACVFKRARGEGIIRSVEGLEGLFARYGEHIATVDLTPIGQPKRDHRQMVAGDGWVVVRHPDLQSTLEMADAVGTDLRLIAG
ncbi:MAG: ATP-grasp domain-containing protein [Planctomycetota bacterium]|nr:MAG: ATP-grasp domain-containing protein [Planctomycetota bacterium]